MRHSNSNEISPEELTIKQFFSKLKIGQAWVHLRKCLECGHVGCCDQSIGKHATKHAQATGHAVIRSIEPGEDWLWCYVDEVMFDLGDRATPQRGPIPRYY